MVRVTADPGESFLDKMIGLVEGVSRQKTPNELALSVLLAGLTLTFLIVVDTLDPIARYVGGNIDIATLIALLVCLIPTTIGALLSAIGIAGMDRVIRFNVIAKSGKAVEAAGDVNTLILDKTGTIMSKDKKVSAFRTKEYRLSRFPGRTPRFLDNRVSAYSRKKDNIVSVLSRTTGKSFGPSDRTVRTL